jgi:hypothetical protein
VAQIWRGVRAGGRPGNEGATAAQHELDRVCRPQAAHAVVAHHLPRPHLEWEPLMPTRASTPSAFGAAATSTQQGWRDHRGWRDTRGQARPAPERRSSLAAKCQLQSSAPVVSSSRQLKPSAPGVRRVHAGCAAKGLSRWAVGEVPRGASTRMSHGARRARAGRSGGRILASWLSACAGDHGPPRSSTRSISGTQPRICSAACRICEATPAAERASVTNVLPGAPTTAIQRSACTGKTWARRLATVFSVCVVCMIRGRTAPPYVGVARPQHPGERPVNSAGRAGPQAQPASQNSSDWIQPSRESLLASVERPPSRTSPVGSILPMGVLLQ